MRNSIRHAVSGIAAAAVLAAVSAGYDLMAQAGRGAGAGQGTAASTPTALSREWPTYNHDPEGMRFSPLQQLTPANVSQLDVAWVYHMRPAPTADAGAAPAGPAGAAGGAGPAPDGRAAGGRGRGGTGFSASQATPLVVNGTMYLATPYFRVVAIDATTGKETWSYRLPTGNPSMRGVDYWPGDG